LRASNAVAGDRRGESLVGEMDDDGEGDSEGDSVDDEEVDEDEAAEAFSSATIMVVEDVEDEEHDAALCGV
jgi:hypothetical protein